jgi:hypothetical protein
MLDFSFPSYTGARDFVGISGVFVRDFERRFDVLLAMKSSPNVMANNRRS